MSVCFQRWCAGAIWLGAAFAVTAAEAIVSATRATNEFALVGPESPVPIWFDANDHAVVAIAARDFADDVERVTSKKPSISSAAEPPGPEVVIIGTINRSALIDGLVQAGKLDVSRLTGQWETFLITTVEDPRPGVSRALVIAGSDRRGTAFGVYELSQQIGVSPCYWWADVPPKRSPELYVRAGATLFGPPSVKYRGIFINDEDWGLQPWAAETFAPEEGGIGPRVYRKVFELLLRLKANTLWPAMHACTKPFNAFPESAQLAEDYAIVMGSSHAEPMLRNNVGEWTAPHEEYNYVTNREGVLRYWEERVATNGRFENIYTIGMRGIHDSAIQGTKSDAERIRVLEQVFADQRSLLARHVVREVERVPQMFCAYKEVLDLYRQGLKVPDDVTIVWPDDNFGYIRNFATPEEQRTRTGGFGVYYHISYLGRPLAYLWLCTTPPALIWEEMSKAYDHGARQIWIVNVGDIKPAEIGTEFFLQMAWDITRWNRETLPNFLEEWATREFGGEHAREIAAILREYYQLNFQRKPEHLQWWLPQEEARPGALNAEEIDERIRRFIALSGRAAALEPLPSRRRESGDAFFQLVSYPVMASSAANLRYLSGELAAAAAADQRDIYSEQAKGFDEFLQVLTRRYAGLVPPQKWAGFMRLEPADEDWRSMRIAPWRIPEYERSLHAVTSPVPFRASADGADFGEVAGVVSAEAEGFSRRIRADAGQSWEKVLGLGRSGEGSVTVFPSVAATIEESKLQTDAPRLEYDVNFATAGVFDLSANLIPTHPIVAGRGLRFAVGLNNQPLQVVVVSREVGDAAWSQSVLNNTVIGTAKIAVPAPGEHVLKIYMVDAGVVLDKIVIDCGGLTPSYLGPPETRAAGE